MKNNNIIILAGAALAGIAYAVGKKNGHNECLYKCQQAVVNSIVKNEKEKKEEESWFGALLFVLVIFTLRIIERR